MTPVEHLMSLLDNVHRNGSGWMARCPAHHDQQNSLSLHQGDDGRALIHCFAGCSERAVLAALGLAVRELFPSRNGRGDRGIIPSEARATPQPPRKNQDGARHSAVAWESATARNPATADAPRGLTLAQYAEAKRLPVDFLRALGLRDATCDGQPAVKMPYLDSSGVECGTRFRLSLKEEPRFKWRRGEKLTLYGLWKRSEARAAGRTVLCEGESDCHTLWHHDIPAIGLPGAANWREERDAPHLDDLQAIYVILEPDRGGERVLEWLAKSRIRERAHLVRIEGAKDPSALYLSDPERFTERLEQALRHATPWPEHERLHRAVQASAALAQCGDLARAPNILERFVNDLQRTGVAGETRAAKLVYLALVSRLLPRPVSVALKGPSAAGKSHLVERVLAFFPPSAYYALSSMSERALAYSEEPLAHRVIVLYEAAGLRSDFASYLMRSLLSEGRVRYETVEKTPNGLKPRLIEREGPSGLLVTTTAVRLHPENETRMLSIPVDDTPEQTREVLLAQADEDTVPPSVTPWCALQEWLRHADHAVTIPFGRSLAETIPAVAVRLRRDFPAVLSLIRAHAVLHQLSRKRDSQGRIIATEEDYRAVRDLIADLVAEGVGAAVSPAVRETVGTVRELAGQGDDPPTTVVAVARALKLDKSAAWRRVNVALERGYLKNLEDKRGRPANLVLGDPLPAEVVILPPPDAVQGCAVAQPCNGTATTKSQAAQGERDIGCTIADREEGINTPSAYTCRHCGAAVAPDPDDENPAWLVYECRTCRHIGWLEGAEDG